MNGEDGLICAYVLDGNGGGREVGWNEIREWTPADGPIWIHLNRESDESQNWLDEESGLDPILCEAMCAEDTRPRCEVSGDGMLVILRGVNLNPGAAPDDMISIRMWMDAHRVISLRSPRLRAVDDIRNAIAAGEGPSGSGDFLVQLTKQLIERMAPVLSNLDDEVNGIEEEILEAGCYSDLRAKLGGLRRQAIALRRYLAPQRDVLFRLQTERVSWLRDHHRAHLRMITDRIIRYVEDLDEAREHAAVTQDELSNRLSERMNRTMYILSVVAAVFLPLGLLTGLLGINVGGIPGTENHWAFTVVCVMLGMIGVVQAWLFRRMRLF